MTRDDWVGPSVGRRIFENDLFRTDRLTKGNLLRGFALCSCWLPVIAQPYQCLESDESQIMNSYGPSDPFSPWLSRTLLRKSTGQLRKAVRRVSFEMTIHEIMHAIGLQFLVLLVSVDEDWGEPFVFDKEIVEYNHSGVEMNRVVNKRIQKETLFALRLAFALCSCWLPAISGRADSM